MVRAPEGLPDLQHGVFFASPIRTPSMVDSIDAPPALNVKGLNLPYPSAFNEAALFDDGRFVDLIRSLRRQKSNMHTTRALLPRRGHKRAKYPHLHVAGI